MQPALFQSVILKWFDLHGRKHLPWQHNKTPYRVWISEIMLQQTQVKTVIPYFERFMQHFPDVVSLAHAKEDEVLHLWAGLGYYSRARNLQRAAKMVMDQFDGQFPDQPDDLQQLPGIGPSTAGAILSIAFNQRCAILDGNVKRVIARLHAITDPINDKKVENILWEIAKRYTPTKRVADYTQAMMDLGATLCVRGKPQCERCPLSTHCLAKKEGLETILPISKKTRAIPTRTTTFIIFHQGKNVFLQKRPPSGIWGGLWGFPELNGEPDKEKVQFFCKEHFKLSISDYEALTPFRHSFTHYHLNIHPILIPVKKIALKAAQQIWYNPHQPPPIGLPKPVQSIVSLLT